jgi:transposase-like protein
MSQRKKLKVVLSNASPIAAEAALAGGASAASAAAPDPEVRAVAARRHFSAAYKLSVLEEADRAADPGAIGALLRREGLYSSHLSTWRRERRQGALAGLSRTRGRKLRLTPEQRRIAELETRCARLERDLSQALTVIEVQKKLCTLLGVPTAASEPNIGNGS